MSIPTGSFLEKWMMSRELPFINLSRLDVFSGIEMKFPPNLRFLWLQAKSMIPNWPGFQRLHLTEDQMNEVIACEKNSEELFRALMESSDQFKLKKEKDGTSTFSASFDITPETEEVKKPWWKFWKRS